MPISTTLSYSTGIESCSIPSRWYTTLVHLGALIDHGKLDAVDTCMTESAGAIASRWGHH
jgi:hypothetical protein